MTKLILIDKDNTLVPMGSHTATDAARFFVDRCRIYGIKVVIVSNSGSAQPVADSLGVDCIQYAMKPFISPDVQSLVAKHGVEHTVVIGDNPSSDGVLARQLGCGYTQVSKHVTMLSCPLKLMKEANKAYLRGFVGFNFIRGAVSDVVATVLK